MEKVRLIETGFPTADSEYPVVVADGGTLTLKFEDWQEKAIEVYLGEPVAYKWQMAESLWIGERNDSCYEVDNSTWLAAHVGQEIVSEEEKYKHYRFNFNENGNLEVLAIGYMYKSES